MFEIIAINFMFKQLFKRKYTKLSMPANTIENELERKKRKRRSSGVI